MQFKVLTIQNVILIMALLIARAGMAQDTTQTNILQAKPMPKRWFCVGLSANAYRGDLSSRYAAWTPAFVAALQLNRAKRLNGSLQLSIGSVQGQQLGYNYTDNQNPSSTPNNYFKTSFFCLGYQLQYNLIKTRKFCWYVAQGFEFMRFTPRDNQDKALADQKNTRAQEETYGSSSTTLPTSMGMNYFFENGIGLGIKTGWRNPSTDYLDNISKLSNSNQKDNIAFFTWQVFLPFSNLK